MAILNTNYSLKKHNTFGIDVNAKYFFEFETIEEIKQFLNDNPLTSTKYLILGGGSNLLFTGDFEGIVIHPDIRGLEITDEEEDHILVRAGANEVWDDLVEWCVNHNLGGIENLSHIPGVVGAVPIQNIGAYGVEAHEVIKEVEAISIESGKLVTFSNSQCEFGYRDSIFKNGLKNQFIITHVTFRLSKTPQLKTHYGTVERELNRYTEIKLANVREVITNIRKSKLPDPQKTGNAGSFFKNPVITSDKARKLKLKYPQMPTYPVDETYCKLAAGWLIEQCGWRGKRIGNAAVHKDQALVLINCGNATGLEILKLANEIRKSVLLKFNISLEMEVNAV